MTYSTPQSVRAVLAQDGSTDPSTAASLDDPTLQGACNRAAAEVDAWLGGRYQVPFDVPPGSSVPVPGSAPALIYDISDSIASYLATLLYRQGQPIEPTDPVYQAWQRAERMLSLLSVGTMALEIGGSESAEADPTVVNNYTGELFSMRDYGIGVALGASGRRGVFPPNWPL